MTFRNIYKFNSSFLSSQYSLQALDSGLTFVPVDGESDSEADEYAFFSIGYRVKHISKYFFLDCIVLIFTSLLRFHIYSRLSISNQIIEDPFR